jgi:uroporphyrinogen-III synthase
MAPTILITRPREEAARTAAAFKARGFETLIEPMLDVVPVDDPTFSTEDAQAILLTSGNGARALGRTQVPRDMPVFTVGDRTAEEARAQGFTRVEAAGGNVEALAALVTAQLDPSGGPLIHISGRDVAGDLEGAVTAKAFTYRRHVLYKAHAAERFSEALTAALRAHTIAGVIFYSARTATTFVMLAKRAGLAEAFEAMTAICLSEAVAAAARELNWGHIQITPRPEVEARIA